MKNVLLAGGRGFLGSHLHDRLLRRSDLNSVVIVDNVWTGALSNLAHIDDAGLPIVECGIDDYRPDTLFDEVIQFGSPASPPWYMQEPVRTIEDNVDGPLNILNLLKKDGRLCFASNSEVHGDPLVSPQPETYRGPVDCTGPRSAYNEARRCTESILFESRRTTGLDIRLIRLFVVYGPRTRLDDGRAVSDPFGQALTTCELIVCGDLSRTRSWGYVDDIIDALKRYFWLDGLPHPGPPNIVKKAQSAGARHRAVRGAGYLRRARNLRPAHTARPHQLLPRSHPLPPGASGPGGARVLRRGHPPNDRMVQERDRARPGRSARPCRGSPLIWAERRAISGTCHHRDHTPRASPRGPACARLVVRVSNITARVLRL